MFQDISHNCVIPFIFYRSDLRMTKTEFLPPPRNPPLNPKRKHHLHHHAPEEVGAIHTLGFPRTCPLPPSPRNPVSIPHTKLSWSRKLWWRLLLFRPSTVRFAAAMKTVVGTRPLPPCRPRPNLII